MRIIATLAVLGLSACTNADASRETLDNFGFKNIQTGGYVVFACGEDYIPHSIYGHESERETGFRRSLLRSLQGLLGEVLMTDFDPRAGDELERFIESMREVDWIEVMGLFAALLLILCAYSWGAR